MVPPSSGVVQPAAGTAAGQVPWFSTHLPHGSEHPIGVAHVERNIDGSGVAVDAEHPLPPSAAICRAEDAAFVVCAERVAERRDEDNVGIRGVDQYLADMPRIGQSDVLPRLARVNRLVHTIAVRHVVSRVGVSGADVQCSRMRGGDAEGPDGADRLAVKHRSPPMSAVRCFPDAAAGAAEIGTCRGRPGYPQRW